LTKKNGASGGGGGFFSLTGISAAEAEPHVMVATAIASTAETDSDLLLTDIKPPSVGNVSYLT
jgi:hypothetical protein